jgi:hypothetical protein
VHSGCNCRENVTVCGSGDRCRVADTPHCCEFRTFRAAAKSEAVNSNGRGVLRWLKQEGGSHG